MVKIILKFLVKIIILLMSIVFFFILCECGVRVFAGDAKRVVKYVPGSIIEDSRYGVKFKPNFEGVIDDPEFVMKYRTNSLGFRGKEIDSKEGTRIICLGDSMTFGYGVNEEDLFVTWIAEDLGVESINMGVSGYDIDRYMLLFEDYVVHNDPDLLVLFFTIINDFGESVKKGEALGIKEKAALSKGGVGEFKKLLFRHSRFYQWVKDRVNRTSMLNVLLIRMGVRSAGDIFLKEYPPVMERKVDRVRMVLTSIKEAADINGFEILLVGIPDSIQVYEGMSLDKRYWDIEKPNDILREIADDVKIDYLDLLPAFRKNSNRLFFKYDGHLNPEGHRETARIVSGFIRDKRLIVNK